MNFNYERSLVLNKGSKKCLLGCVTRSSSLTLVLTFVMSCSTTHKKVESIFDSIKNCKSSQCEIEKYELLLKTIGMAESDLKDGNSFKALRELEEIKEQAYYHGRFKSLYYLAQESCFISTNELSKKENSCSLVRERVSFIKTVSPDKLNKVSIAISNCRIDISKNAKRFNIEKVSKDLDLTDQEIKDGNVYEKAVKIQQQFNSNPWEELLLIDLKTLSNFKLNLRRPVIQKETPVGFVRFKVPLEIKSEGKISYCSQYKAVIHDEDLLGTINCFDYADFSDQISGIFSRGSARPHQWTEGSYLTTMKISNASRQYVRELPFIKNYKNGLALDIQYGSGKTTTVWPELSYPGELIHNLMGRLAYMVKGGNLVPEVYIEGKSSTGIRFKIVKREPSITDFWGGYDMDIILPLEMARDLQSFKLSVPVQKILEYFHEIAVKEELLSGGVYGY